MATRLSRLMKEWKLLEEAPDLFVEQAVEYPPGTVRTFMGDAVSTRIYDEWLLIRVVYEHGTHRVKIPLS